MLRRRRYSRYPSSYRRRRRFQPAAVLRVLCTLAVLAAVVLAGYMVYKALVSGRVIAALEQQNRQLQQQVDDLSAIVPDPALSRSLQEQSLSYQSLYPDMQVTPAPAFAPPADKTVYLTFDDGPSKNTLAILDALQAAGQKATFFVIGKGIPGNEAVLKRIVDEGHAIGVHSYSHDYAAVYASVESFLDDFHQTYTAIHAATGVYPTIFRFPGGSVNSYSRGVYQQIIAEMLRRGFVFYDWSVSSGDADDRCTAGSLQQAVLSGVPDAQIPIVWMHDSMQKTTTAGALPALLNALTGAGYTCAPLTNTVRPVTFQYHA